MVFNSRSVKRVFVPAANNPWDQQLREVVREWWARVLEVGGMSAAEIKAAVKKKGAGDASTLSKMVNGHQTPRGKLLTAISEVTGVPLPSLRDETDYVALYAARRATVRASTSAAAAEQLRLDALAPEPDQPAEEKPRKRGQGGKR
jgi:hypothetical protein